MYIVNIKLDIVNIKIDIVYIFSIQFVGGNK